MQERGENFVKFFNEMINQSKMDNMNNITQQYVEGRIDKNEFMRRMKNADKI